MRQHESVMERRAPPDQAALEWLFPEHANQSADQQHLHESHSDMRRHFERAQFQQAKAQPQTLGRIKLVDAELGAMRVSGDVDQQVAEQSIHDQRRAIARRQMTECHLQLIQGIHARLVYPRILARRADIHAGKQIRQRRMVLPERHHAAQQIRTAQKRAVRDRRPADHDMAAAAGGDMASVVGEFLGGQPVTARFLEEHRVDLFEFVPIAGRRQVYFQNARDRE